MQEPKTMKKKQQKWQSNNAQGTKIKEQNQVAKQP